MDFLAYDILDLQCILEPRCLDEFPNLKDFLTRFEVIPMLPLVFMSLLLPFPDTFLCVCMLNCFSHVQLFVTLQTVACQAPLSMGLSREEYWSGLLCPPPGDLPSPKIKPASLSSPALIDEFFITRCATWEAWMIS